MTELYTAEGRFNAVQCCKLLHKYLQGLRQNINQIRKRHPLWVVFCEYLWENWPCYYNTTMLNNDGGLKIHLQVEPIRRSVSIVNDALINIVKLLWRLDYFSEFHEGTPLLTWSISIPAWMSNCLNCIYNKVRDEKNVLCVNYAAVWSIGMDK